MTMKSLKTIQTLSKIGKILSKIVYICCMIGFIGYAVGLVAISIGGTTIKLDGAALNDILSNEAISTGTALAALVGGLILCVGEYIVARMAYHYFDRELNAGTPFTLEGAKELMHLGISAIWIPIVCAVLAQVAQGIIGAIMENVEALTIDGGDSVELGIMLIVVSLFCRYGAELAGNQAKNEQDSNNTANGSAS